MSCRTSLELPRGTDHGPVLIPGLPSVCGPARPDRVDGALQAEADEDGSRDQDRVVVVLRPAQRAFAGLFSVAASFLCAEGAHTTRALSPQNPRMPHAPRSRSRAGRALSCPSGTRRTRPWGIRLPGLSLLRGHDLHVPRGVHHSGPLMAAIEVITSQEKEIIIKRDNGETTTPLYESGNETVSNLTLMTLSPALQRSCCRLSRSVDTISRPVSWGCPLIVGSAAFNMFVIIGLCVSVIPEGETRKCSVLPVVQIWEGLLTLAFFPHLRHPGLGGTATFQVHAQEVPRRQPPPRRHHRDGTRTLQGHEMMDGGKMANSHFDHDGGPAHNLISLIESLEVDESRRDMIRILKDLKQKHPEKEMDQLVEMANYYALSHQQKSRAFTASRPPA
ncbi:hypothetical protein DPEC_G00366130 [Dallia pectoralis]|nr:hypothetical protein DPEC_G00366130 [Dallia pectoralis]